MQTALRVGLRRFVALAALCASAAASAQAGHRHPSPETLGSVSFNTSCSRAVQPQFNRAVALMHSFQFAGAIEAFHSILAADPACAMADWGIALSSWGNPFAAGLKSPAQMERGRNAVEQARAAHPRTARERAYIEAVAHLYADSAALDQGARVLAYGNAMATVSAAYPDDTEATIFYALSLAQAADPADKTYAKQLKAGAILEALFAQHPDHPGLAHYIIHAYDVPPLAARALVAAERYRAIAPSTPHALHMPSHTFTRVGDWQRSIDANLASADSARSTGQVPEEMHATDYMVYAYLQTGQDTAARHLVESSVATFARLDPNEVVGGAASPSAAYFARAAIPARYCLERGAWADAARLEPLRSPYPHADAITYFARGLGAARSGDRAAALSAIASLAGLRDALTGAHESYWAEQVEIERQEVAAWLAFVGGDAPGGVAGMRAAAEREDRTEKNAVTPGPLAPAHELLGEMLLALGRPAEALREFEATLTREPNRFRALYGAAEAAKLTGDHSAAQTYFRHLLDTAKRADTPGRREVAEAHLAVHP